MPRDDACSHRNCDGGPCKQLTSDELAPTAEDLAYAQQLIDEDWRSISRKFRHVARYVPPRPTGDEIIRPEYRELWGDEFIHMWNSWYGHGLRMGKNTETRTLTVKQYQAFKKLGGQSA